MRFGKDFSGALTIKQILESILNKLCEGMIKDMYKSGYIPKVMLRNFNKKQLEDYKSN